MAFFLARNKAVILQLNPPLWFETPKGRALAHFVVDTSLEHEMEFVCFHQNGEVWSWSQRDVRATTNLTIGRETVAPSGSTPWPPGTHISLVETAKD